MTIDLKTLKQRFVEKLAESGLTVDDAKKLKLVPLVAEEVKQLKLPATNAGFKIPYFTMAGNISNFFRFRYLEDTRVGFEKLTGKKPLRYGQVSTTLNEVYFPANFGWKSWVPKKEPLIITEGELKAAAACKLKIPTIGLGGVWCFMSKKANLPLLKEFYDLELKERIVVLCYDSDAASNPDVVNAEAALAKKLLDLGAYVKILRLPNVFEESTNKKTGLDDYLVAKGVDAFLQLISDCDDYDSSKELHGLNSEVVYIRATGSIYAYEHDIQMRPTDFTGHAYANRWHYEKVETEKTVKLIKKKTSQVWLEWPERAELKAVTFEPGQPKITPTRKLNLWNGWAIEPKKGDIAPWRALLDHLFKDEPQAVVKWFEQWCAYPLQNPGAKMTTSVLVWGVLEGTGKTTLGNTISQIYGDYGIELKDSDLDDPRNEWAERKQFVVFDDITGSDSRLKANRLKTLISQKTMRLNPKYIQSFSIPDCINYFFTSNEPAALFLDSTNRRNFIHQVKAGKLTANFKEEFFSWRDREDGLAALFHHLIHVDLSGFDPNGDAMHTSSKARMTLIGKSELGTWVQRLYEDPEHTLNTHIKGDLATTEELLLVYDPNGDKRVTPNAIAKELLRMSFEQPAGETPVKTLTGQKRPFAVRNREVWRMAKYSEIREHYDNHHPALPGKKY